MQITQAQIYAALRYAGVAAGAVTTLAAAIGVMDASTAQSITTAFQKVMVDLQQLIGDLSKLVVLVVPVVTVWLARVGVKAASLKSQIASVQAHPDAQVVVTDPKLAEGVPGVKVVEKGK